MSELMRSPVVRLKLRKLFWVVVLWLIVGTIQYWYDQSILLAADVENDLSKAMRIYFNSLVSVVTAGLIGGSFVVFLFETWIRIWPYWKVTAGILLVFSAVFMLSTSVGFMLTADDILDIQGASRDWNQFADFVGSLPFVRNYLFWLMVVLLTLIGLTVYDKYGPGTLHKLLVGEYFRPREEHRVFMFLDLRSSTQIAEELGERKYFNLLRDVIQDVTDEILNSKGEIYQYVGDEIVISWPLSTAARNANCIRCFFRIRETIASRTAYYKQAYGILPEFKAGLHFGSVIAGEIGVIKRDIAYAGDVLNTTARIQAKCNDLGVDILISKQLLDNLDLTLSHLTPRIIGNVALRGKKEEELLFTV